MPFFTYGELEAPLTKSLNEKMFRAASETAKDKTVFLSHSTQDHDYVVGVIQLFEKYGGTTYVDDGDERLPNTPNQHTADILKCQIDRCPRFVVLVSPSSAESSWIPWELGLADVFNGVGRVAVFPIDKTSNEGEWARREYLGLYPMIKWMDRKNEPDHISLKPRVWDPRDNGSWSLKTWLTDDSIK